MTAFRYGLLAMQRRTDVLGASETEDKARLKINAEADAVVRHVLAGYIPVGDVDDAADWTSEMARHIVQSITEMMAATLTNGGDVVLVGDEDAMLAATRVALAQTLGIGAATERSASGKTV